MCAILSFDEIPDVGMRIKGGKRECTYVAFKKIKILKVAALKDVGVEVYGRLKGVGGEVVEGNMYLI